MSTRSVRSSSTTARRRHPVLAVTMAALAVQCLVQAVAARSVATSQWWQVELIRGRVRVNHPAAASAQRLPMPDWHAWLPSAGGAVAVTVALVLLALGLVRAGRGWWLLVAAAAPLVPAQVLPGSWAPMVPNPITSALVWPAGQTAPSITWPWVDAAITALVVAIPAASAAVHPRRRPDRTPGQVLGALAPSGTAVVLVAGWERHATGWSADPWTAGWVVLFVVAGALVVTGTGLARGRLARGALTAGVLGLPALADGLVRWAAGPAGTPVLVVDRSAAWMSAAAAAGAVAALAQPALSRLVGRACTAWWGLLTTDVNVRNAVRDTARDQRLPPARETHTQRPPKVLAETLVSGTGPDRPPDPAAIGPRSRGPRLDRLALGALTRARPGVGAIGATTLRTGAPAPAVAAVHGSAGPGGPGRERSAVGGQATDARDRRAGPVSRRASHVAPARAGGRHRA